VAISVSSAGKKFKIKERKGGRIFIFPKSDANKGGPAPGARKTQKKKGGKRFVRSIRKSPLVSQAAKERRGVP